jgi:hypothetical protein
MPVAQLVPPGGLDQHGVLVALSPALLAAAAGSAAAMVGDSRAARGLACAGLVAALGLQALFLLPGGAAAAYTEPLAHGLVRVGPLQTGGALVLGAWAAWRWFPRYDPAIQRLRPVWAWCLRVALGLVLPVAALPLLLIGCEGDAPPPAPTGALDPGRAAARGRAVRLAAAALLTGAALALLGTAIGVHLAWWLTALAWLVAAVSAGGPWRIPLIAVAIAFPAW